MDYFEDDLAVGESADGPAVPRPDRPHRSAIEQAVRTLNDVLAPRGVAVVIEASHGCMSSRGVNQHGVSMVTQCWLGDFREDAALRRELLDTLPLR